MRTIIIALILLLLLSGCRCWYQPGIKLENTKKDCKLAMAMETDDFEYSMFLRGYKKVKPPKGVRTDWFIYKGKIVTVAGE